MKLFIFFRPAAWITAGLAVVCILLSARGVCAQGAPDILWSTNAYGPDSYIFVAFSPDSAILATAGRPLQPDQPREIRVWRVADASLLRAIRLPRLNDWVTVLSFGPEGDSLIAGGSSSSGDDHVAKVWRWRVSDGTLIRAWDYGWEHSVKSFAPSPDRQFLAVAIGDDDFRGVLAVLGAANFAPLAFIFRDFRPDNYADGVSFSPVGRLYATGHRDGTVKLWSYTNGFSDDSLLQSFPSHSSRVRKVAFLSEGDLLLSVSSGGDAIVRRVQDGEILRRFGEGGVEDAAVSAEGKILLTKAYTGSLPAPLRFWRIADGALLKLYNAETEYARSVALSPDNRFFAYGQGSGRLVLARMPALITETQTIGNQLLLRWQGGSGRYQLQRCETVSGNTWLNVGDPTTNRSATLSITNTNWFFRVESLPNPP